MPQQGPGSFEHRVAEPHLGVGRPGRQRQVAVEPARRLRAGNGELLTISHGWKNPIIMIDDFEVPGDPGYAFDDYGEGLRLTGDYVPLAEMGEFDLLFPTCPSTSEGGSRRGCTVIASPSQAAKFATDGVPLVARG